MSDRDAELYLVRPELADTAPATAARVRASKSRARASIVGLGEEINICIDKARVRRQQADNLERTAAYRLRQMWRR